MSDSSAPFPRVRLRACLPETFLVVTSALQVVCSTAWAMTVRTFGAFLPPEAELAPPPALVVSQAAFVLAAVWFLAEFGRLRRSDPVIAGPACCVAWFFPLMRPHVPAGSDAVIAALAFVASLVWALDLVSARSGRA